MAGELLVGGGPGRGDGGADPAGGVRLPGHPGRELLRPGRRRRPGGCGCRRSRGARPGRRRRRARRPPGASAAGPTQATVAALDDQGGVRRSAPSRSSARRVVGDQLADVGDAGCWSRPEPPRSRRSRRRARGRRPPRSPCRTTTRPSTTTWVTSSAAAAKTAVCSSAPVPAVRGRASVSSVTRSARRPTAIRAGVVEAEAVVAGRAWRPRAARPRSSGRAAGWPAARRARRPASPRTGRSPRGCRSPASAGCPASCSARLGPDAVAEVALGGRAEAGVGRAARRGSRTSSSVRWVAWTARGQRAERAGVGEQPGSG